MRTRAKVFLCCPLLSRGSEIHSANETSSKIDKSIFWNADRVFPSSWRKDLDVHEVPPFGTMTVSRATVWSLDSRSALLTIVLEQQYISDEGGEYESSMELYSLLCEIFENKSHPIFDVCRQNLRDSNFDFSWAFSINAIVPKDDLGNVDVLNNLIGGNVRDITDEFVRSSKISQIRFGYTGAAFFLRNEFYNDPETIQRLAFWNGRLFLSFASINEHILKLTDFRSNILRGKRFRGSDFDAFIAFKQQSTNDLIRISSSFCADWFEIDVYEHGLEPSGILSAKSEFLELSAQVESVVRHFEERRQRRDSSIINALLTFIGLSGAFSIFSYLNEFQSRQNLPDENFVLGFEFYGAAFIAFSMILFLVFMFIRNIKRND